MDKPKILIVEDELIVALDIERQLKRLGYSVAGIHASGEDAIHDFEKLNPDLVLMDIMLQGKMDGVETGKMIHDQYHIPVIFITAYADEKTIQRAKFIEPFGYIIKPFEERELHTTIEMTLYKSKIDKALAEREHLLSITLGSINDAVIVTNGENKIEFLNPAAARLIGLKSDDAINKDFTELFKIKYLKQNSSSVYPDNETSELLSMGHSIPIEIYSSPIIDERKKKFGTVWALHDISERKQAEKARKQLEEQLRQSQRMEAMGRLAGGIAHDFNNILTVIMGYSTMIVEKLKEQSPINQDIEGIRDAARKAVTLTRQLLTFSRSQILKPEVINLNKLVKDIEKMIKRLIREDITVQLQLDSDFPYVFIDPNQMEQVLINLSVNARDAMPSGGTLIIETKNVTLNEPDVSAMGTVPPGTYVSLCVTDSGIGMEEESLPQIFEPFFTTKPKEKGTGLGLSTVYGIINKSNGFIQVKSSRYRGSTFIILLPQVDKMEKKDELKDSYIPQVEGTETILLVEDEDNLRALIRKMLARSGYKVLEANNAGEALLICEEYKKEIHLLISDIIMPYLSGDKLAFRLKANRPNLKILLMSGYPDRFIKGQASLTNDIFFLQKPFDPEALIKRVRKILDT
ncbi:MAG: response regulator [Spirochaetota bacterium]